MKHHQVVTFILSIQPTRSSPTTPLPPIDSHYFYRHNPAEISRRGSLTSPESSPEAPDRSTKQVKEADLGAYRWPTSTITYNPCLAIPSEKPALVRKQHTKLLLNSKAENVKSDQLWPSVWPAQVISDDTDNFTWLSSTLKKDPNQQFPPRMPCSCRKITRKIVAGAMG